MVRIVLIAAALACAAISARAKEKAFSEAEVEAAVARLVSERTRDGVYELHDARTGQDLALVYDKVRLVRGLAAHGWFPEIIFHAKEEPAREYAVDFWLKPDGDRLQLIDVRVHKDPQPDGKSWMMITRAPLLWWWLPTLERASAVVGKQAWEIMGALHEHIVAARKDGAFPLTLPGGKTIPAELMEIYQPVGRSKTDGRYIACAALRNIGTPPAVYSVDFWVEPDTGSVTVGAVHPFDSPRADSGQSASEPHCRFEGLAFDVVE
jgi:hypothetical protein